MWVNYKYLDKSFVGQYFKVGCDVISVTMTTLKVHKKNLKISVFAICLKKSVTYPFYCIFGKLPKFFNFCDGMAKSYSVELKLYRKSHFCNSKKFHWIACLQTPQFELAQLMLHSCKKIRIGHRAKFRDKNKCLVHVLFPVCAILRGILTSGSCARDF